MHSSSITKYQFRIRTRSGAVVENLLIAGDSESIACARLRQIYNGCEIIESHRLPVSLAGRHGPLNYEDVVDLIIAG